MAVDEHTWAALLSGLGQGLTRLRVLREGRQQQQYQALQRQRENEAILGRMLAIQDRIERRERLREMSTRERVIEERAFEAEKEQRRERFERGGKARQYDIEQRRTALKEETAERQRQRKLQEDLDERFKLWVRGELEPATDRERQYFEAKYRKDTGEDEKKKPKRATRVDLFREWAKLSEDERGRLEDRYGVTDFETFQKFWRQFVEEPEEPTGAGPGGVPTAAAAPYMAVPVQTGRQGLDAYNAAVAAGAQGVVPQDFEPAIPMRERAAQEVSSLPGFSDMPVVQQQLLIDLKVRELQDSVGVQ